jgi:hypothetical protein
MNPVSREDPETGRPDYTASPQPIRNGGVANLALELIGLPAVPGSSIDVLQDLDAAAPSAGDLPSVSITSPPAGSVFEVLSTVVIGASAEAGSGGIAKVEFFANWSKLGEDTSSPYEHIWSDVPLGVYVLTARAVQDNGLAAAVNADIEVETSVDVDGGSSMILAPPRIYPNPFGCSTRIEFSLPSNERVELAIYDCRGREVETLLADRCDPGTYVKSFDARRLPSGMYFYRLKIGANEQSGKLAVVK